jgi:hypothetical protein
VKICTYSNFACVLLNGYDVENPLGVSARSFYLCLNLIMDNWIKPSSGLFVRPETRFDREPIFY